MSKNITGYNAKIKFNNKKKVEDVYIKVGSFDLETATEQEKIEDESVFFYIDTPIEIATLSKPDNGEDFVVISAEPVYDTQSEQEDDYEIESLKELNIKIFHLLLNVLESHTINGGKLDYSEKDYGYINDTIDLIEVKYFNEEPDGDRQNELAEDNEIAMLTDEEAYKELITRFNNLTF